MIRTFLATTPLLLAACSDHSASATRESPVTAVATPPTDSGEHVCDAQRPAFDALVRKFDASLAQQHLVGGSIAVLCKGTQIFAAGVGKKQKNKPEVVAADTRFQIASITKTFTATAALRLAERGKIHLDGAVRDVIPELDGAAPYERSFTWSELLSHTSGFPNTFDTDATLDLGERVRRHGNDKLWSPPGALFNYSNEGFAVAGYGLQNASGSPIRALLETEVFATAQMTHATMDPNRVESEGGYAVGHTDGGRFVRPTDSYLGSTYYAPMGGAWASAEDMAKFARAFVAPEGPLLQPASRDAMTRAVTPAWPGKSYGYGIEVIDHGTGIVEWHHDGGVAGYGADIAMFPSEGFAIVVLLNSDAGWFDIKEEAFTAFTSKALPHAHVAEPQAGDPEETIGTYESVALGTLVVSKNGEKLDLFFARENRHSRLDAARARDLYQFDGSDGYPDDAVFWRGPDGKIRFLASGEGTGERHAP